MTNTLSDFLPQLLTHPEIRELVRTHFGEQASQILQGGTQGSLERDEADELEELISAFMDDHAEEAASFRGLGGSPGSSPAAMTDFQTHHPEAARLLQAQARELELLLGREQAVMALGRKREPFYINVLCWNDIYVVTAEGFEEQWFNNKETAIAFAKSSYEPFIRNATAHWNARQQG